MTQVSAISASSAAVKTVGCPTAACKQTLPDSLLYSIDLGTLESLAAAVMFLVVFYMLCCNLSTWLLLLVLVKSRNLSSREVLCPVDLVFEPPAHLTPLSLHMFLLLITVQPGEGFVFFPLLRLPFLEGSHGKLLFNLLWLTVSASQSSSIAWTP